MKTNNKGSKAKVKDKAQENPVKAKECLKQGVVKESQGLTVGMAKIGVTIVLTKGDCKWLGHDENTKTKDVVLAVRVKLGLPDKAIREKKK